MCGDVMRHKRVVMGMGGSSGSSLSSSSPSSRSSSAFAKDPYLIFLRPPRFFLDSLVTATTAFLRIRAGARAVVFTRAPFPMRARNATAATRKIKIVAGTLPGAAAVLVLILVNRSARSTSSADAAMSCSGDLEICCSKNCFRAFATALIWD